MALSPSEQAIEALKAALDQVPLTAEQRQKTLSEFALRIGQPFVLSQTQPLFQSAPAPSADPRQALQQALDHALESAHTVAEPISQENRASVQKDLIARLQSQMNQGSDGIDHSAIQALVRNSLVQERQRGGLSFTSGCFYALIEAVLGSGVLTAILLVGFSKSLWGMPLILTIVDIFIVVLSLQLLGSLHEHVWLSRPRFWNIFTLIRGALSPVTVPLGVLLYAHEWLWSDYSTNKVGRIMRSLITPITVPVGAIWNLTGYLLASIQKLAMPKKKSDQKPVLAQPEKEKAVSEPIVPKVVPAAA